MLMDQGKPFKKEAARELARMTDDPALARQLVLDELFDLSLYSALHERASAELRPILAQLIEIETRHFNFWQEFFGFHAVALDPMRRVKLWLFTATPSPRRRGGGKRGGRGQHLDGRGRLRGGQLRGRG